jgi:hypothetical protein
VITVDGMLGNGSTVNVVNFAWLVAENETPLHESVLSTLYESKLHVNGGLTGAAFNWRKNKIC